MRTFSLALLFSIALPFHTAAAEAIDTIAAMVNGEAITCYDVSQEKATLQAQLQQAGATDIPGDAALNQRALESRVIKVLQEQEAKSLDIAVHDEEIDAAMAEVEQQNQIPVGQLPEILKAQGIDLEEYRNILRERLLGSKLINLAVRSKINISEESMREYYRKHLKDPKPTREIRLAQIFISVPPSASAEQTAAADKKADTIYNQLNNGADFNRLVALKSDAPNASEGGDMGWVMQGAVSQQFESVFSLPVGGITPPIRSPGGFHIIKVMDEQMKKPDLGESYDEIHARHILIKMPANADESMRAKIMHRAQTIAHEMQGTSDEEFAARAKDASQGPSAEQGGDLGWFRRGSMVEAFENAAFALEAGGTSGVVESEFGLHIIRVVGKRHIDPNAYEAHRESIQQLLTNAEMQSQLPRWIASIKAKANIVEKGCK